MRVATRVRRMREAADVSQQELADGAGCSLSTVIRVENGTTLPGLDVLERMAAVCGRKLVLKFPEEAT